MRRKLLPLPLLLLFSPALGGILKISASQVDLKNQTVEAIGNVTVHYEGFTLRATRLVQNLKTGEIEAFGNVTFEAKNPTLYIKCSEIEVNLEGENATFYNAGGVIKNFYFKSEKLFLNSTLYLFKKICGSECSDFQAEICAQKAYYYPDKGKGVLKDAVIKVERKPVFYTPYYSFLTKRTTGFLPPSAGVDYYGLFFYRQPFFWTIDRSSDMTATSDIRGRELFGAQVEFRKFFSKSFYIQTLNAYYYDRAKDRYWWRGRGYYRENRYLFSGEGFYGKLRYGWDYPSDKDFYYDIFFTNSELHYKSFAESYLVYDLQNRDYNVSAAFRYFYNLASTDRSKDLLVAPDTLLYLKPHRLSFFTYDFLGSFTGFYTENGSFFRLHLRPNFRWSKTIGSVPLTFTFSPSYSYYSNSNRTETQNLLALNFKATSLLYNYDLINTQNWNWTTVWDLTYKFQPLKPKEGPNIDVLDRVAQENLFNLRSLNILSYGGVQVAELLVEQPYNFYSGYNFPTDGVYVPGHWMPLKVSYSLNDPSKFAVLNGQFYYDHQRSKIVYHTEGLTLSVIKTSTTKLSLNLSYTKSVNSAGQPQTDQYSYGFSFGRYNWKVKVKSYYDRIISKTTRQELSLGYYKKCWSLSVNYSREYNRDTGNYNWSAFLTFSVFGRGLNLFLLGGENR